MSLPQSDTTAYFPSPVSLQINTYTVPAIRPPTLVGQKKKLHRACLRCQKLKVSCDEGRPCSRCIKFGKGDCCRDADEIKPARKRRSEEESSALPEMGFVYDLKLGSAEANALQNEIWDISGLGKPVQSAQQPMYMADPLQDRPFMTLTEADIASLFFANLCCIKDTDADQVARLYGFAFDHMQAMKLLQQSQGRGVPQGLYRWMCEAFISRGQVHGIAEHYIKTFASTLNYPFQSETESAVALEETRVRFEQLCAVETAANTGVIGCVYHHGRVVQTYANSKAGYLLGYPDMEIRYSLFNPEDCFWKRVWDPEEWKLLFGRDFATMVQQKPSLDLVVSGYRSTGLKLRFNMKFEYTYSPDGAPVMKFWRFTPTKHVCILKLEGEMKRLQDGGSSVTEIASLAEQAEEEEEHHEPGCVYYASTASGSGH